MVAGVSVQATSGYATSGTAKLYFECVGEGRTVIFLHAGVSDSRMWEPQFAKFAEKYRVVRYDHRGFGKSTSPKEPYTLRDDLLSVMRHLGIAKATLVGCSMGGATALDCALDHPEMVTELVLVGSGASGLNDPKELSAEAINHWTTLISLVQKGEIDQAREIDAKYWIAGPRRSPAALDSAYRERAYQLHRENFKVERFTEQETPLTPPAIGRLREVAAPTLVVIGDEDAEDLIKLANRFAAEIPRVSLVAIKNAAHLPSLEHPVEFNAILERFLPA